MSKCYICEEYHGAVSEPRFKGDVGRNEPGERKINIYMTFTDLENQPVRICPKCLLKHLSRLHRAVEKGQDVIST
jgi:hypothetical protein